MSEIIVKEKEEIKFDIKPENVLEFFFKNKDNTINPIINDFEKLVPAEHRSIDGIIDFLKYNRRAMINIVNTYLKTLPLGDRIVLDESTLNTFIVDTTNEDRDEFIKQICMIFQSNPQLLEKFKQ